MFGGREVGEYPGLQLCLSLYSELIIIVQQESSIHWTFNPGNPHLLKVITHTENNGNLGKLQSTRETMESKSFWVNNLIWQRMRRVKVKFFFTKNNLQVHSLSSGSGYLDLCWNFQLRANYLSCSSYRTQREEQRMFLGALFFYAAKWTFASPPSLPLSSIYIKSSDFYTCII